MKRVFILFLTFSLLAAPMALAEVITPGTGAETIKVGEEITIDDVCTFTVKAVQEYDVFMNQKSGSAQQFLVVSFDMLNWQTEPFYVRTQTSAELVYDEAFEFTSTYLWSNPGGTYLIYDNGDTLYVYGIGKDNMITSGGKTQASTSEIAELANLRVDYSGYYRFYNPIDDYFIAEHDIHDGDKY